VKGLSDPFELEGLKNQLDALTQVDDSRFQQEVEGVKLTVQGRIIAVTSERDKTREFINDNVMNPKKIPEGTRESLKLATETVKVLAEVDASLNMILSSSATGKPSTTFTQKDSPSPVSGTPDTQKASIATAKK
jgi:hypothetical protein